MPTPASGTRFMAGSGKAPALGGVSARAPLGFPGPRPGRHRRQGAQTEEGTEDPTKARGELGPGLEAGLVGLVWGGGRHRVLAVLFERRRAPWSFTAVSPALNRWKPLLTSTCPGPAWGLWRCSVRPLPHAAWSRGHRVALFAGLCLGSFQDGSLAGYTWFLTHAVPHCKFTEITYFEIFRFNS